MPLAPAETCLFPDNLLDPAVAVADASARWWVLHTRPRAEKAVARQLVGREVGFYLPLYEHRLTSGGRVRSSYLPLFPGYVFVRIEEQNKLHVLKVPGAVNLVSFNGKLAALPESSLAIFARSPKNGLMNEKSFSPSAVSAKGRR